MSSLKIDISAGYYILYQKKKWEQMTDVAKGKIIAAIISLEIGSRKKQFTNPLS